MKMVPVDGLWMGHQEHIYIYFFFPLFDITLYNCCNLTPVISMKSGSLIALFIAIALMPKRVTRTNKCLKNICSYK